MVERQKLPRVIVIGASSGIGAAIAEQVVRQDGSVILVGRNRERLVGLADTLGGAEHAVLDIGDADAVRTFFARVEPFDHLVITAADLTYAPYLDMDLDAARRMVDVKFWGYIHATRYGAPKIRAGGSIVLFSGLAAWKPGPDTALIAALNGAVVGLGRALAMELAPIRVNVVAPGMTDTPSWHFLDGEARRTLFRQVAATLPARKVGEPGEVAQAALFLIQNAYITGTVLHVDGGAMLT